MKFYNLSPRCAAGGSNFKAALMLSAWCVFSSAAAFANEVPKSANPRPVARLLSTSGQPVAGGGRARMVTAAPYVPAAVTPSTPVAAMAVTATGDEMRAFDLINAERRARGQKPLAWDASLTHLARYHSGNMARQDFFSHTDADGRNLQGRADAAGLRDWRALGENIAYNQGFQDPVRFAVERWMKSEKHRDNILNAEYTHAGVGIARASDGRLFFTQVFMRR